MQHKNADNVVLIEKCINDYKQLNDRSPSVREIEERTGLSIATVSRYLRYMREKGIIEYGGQRNITTKTDKKVKRTTIRVPILGVIACGIPSFAEENIEAYVQLPVEIFGQGDFYILRAHGDSMIEAGIVDGDLVLIRKQNVANEGQIIVALIGDEATLKRYYPEPENRRIRLHPENSEMKDIFVKNCYIQGVAINVIKNLE